MVLGSKLLIIISQLCFNIHLHQNVRSETQLLFVPVQLFEIISWPDSCLLPTPALPGFTPGRPLIHLDLWTHSALLTESEQAQTSVSWFNPPLLHSLMTQMLF